MIFKLFEYTIILCWNCFIVLTAIVCSMVFKRVADVLMLYLSVMNLLAILRQAVARYFVCLLMLIKYLNVF